MSHMISEFTWVLKSQHDESSGSSADSQTNITDAQYIVVVVMIFVSELCHTCILHGDSNPVLTTRIWSVGLTCNRCAVYSLWTYDQ